MTKSTTLRRHPTAALFAVLFLAIVSSPAGAALYNSWPASPNIPDISGDAIGGVAATDITGIWYAKDAVNNYFRMDLAGAITASDHAEIYGIYITPSAPGPGIPSPSSLVAMLAFDFMGNLYTAASFTPQGGTPESIPYAISNGNTTLEWSVPLTSLNGFFYFMGGTITGGTLNDITSPVGTPIPSSVWLLGTGLVGLIALRRRSRGHA